MIKAHHGLCREGNHQIYMDNKEIWFPRLCLYGLRGESGRVKGSRVELAKNRIKLTWYGISSYKVPNLHLENPIYKIKR